jgi:hypothetical protein
MQQKNKRKFQRYDVPLIVKFRTTYGPTPYSLGLLKNLSYQGIGLESRDFTFIPNENLEMEIKLPQNAASVSLLGSVIWKRSDGNINYAGIQFKVKNKSLHQEIMNKISSYGNIPLGVVTPKEVKVKKETPVRKLAKKLSPKTKEGKVTPPEKPRERDLTEEKIAPPETPVERGLIKEYSTDGSSCSVSFTLPKEAAQGSRTVTIAGDFNNWDVHKSPLSQLPGGDFRITLTLAGGREYRFRYCIDGVRWENDWHADRYVPNSYGSDDSVVQV